MSTIARPRTPWAVWVLVVLLLTLTLTLIWLKRSFSSDPFFVPLAVLLILGYSTVGAVLASRISRNPIGWLMMGIGIAFVVNGPAREYTTYVFETNPGAVC